MNISCTCPGTPHVASQYHLRPQLTCEMSRPHSRGDHLQPPTFSSHRPGKVVITKHPTTSHSTSAHPYRIPFPKTLFCIKGGKCFAVQPHLQARGSNTEKEPTTMPGILLAIFSSCHATHISYSREVLFSTQINNSASRLKCSPTGFMAHGTVCIHAGCHLSMSQNARCRVRCM